MSEQEPKAVRRLSTRTIQENLEHRDVAQDLMHMIEESELIENYFDGGVSLEYVVDRKLTFSHGFVLTARNADDPEDSVSFTVEVGTPASRSRD